MSQLTISVLCPSGHTVTVKVANNDPVLKVLTLACSKRQLDPSKHRLKHNKTVLDNSLSVRLANLGNRARLEMVELTQEELELARKQRAGQQASGGRVTVAVQAEAGRKGAEFALTDSLWTVVSQAGGQLQDDRVPVVILATHAEVRGREALEAATLASLGFAAGNRELVKLKFVDPAREKEVGAKNAESGASGAVSAGPKRGDSPPRRAMRLDEGGSMLEKLVGKDKEAETKKEETEEMEVDQEEMKVEPKEEETPKNNGNDTKELPPPPPIQQSETPQPPSKPEKDDTPTVLHYVGEHNAVVYHADDLSSASSLSLDPDETFFDLTTDELKKRQRELKAEVDRLAGGEDLLTAAQRDARKEADKAAVLGAYRRTVVRVQFPDRTGLRAAFPCGARVSEVAEFVRGFLAPEVAAADFELFTAPPKSVLKGSDTLLDAGLVPMALVHFGTKAGAKSAAATGPYLKTELSEKRSNEKGVVKAALESGVERRKAQN